MNQLPKNNAGSRTAVGYLQIYPRTSFVVDKIHWGTIQGIIYGIPRSDGILPETLYGALIEWLSAVN
jgi:hypothetical protein